MGNNKNYSNKKSSNHSHNNKKKGSLISNVNNHKMNKQDIKNKLNDGVLVYNGPLTVSELAEKLGVAAVDVVRSLFLEKIMVNVNTTLNDDYIELVAANNYQSFNTWSKAWPDGMTVPGFYYYFGNLIFNK